MPLAGFLANLRGFKLGDSGAELARVLDKCRAVAEPWARAGADLVCFDGYLATARSPSVGAISRTQELRLLEPAL